MRWWTLGVLWLAVGVLRDSNPELHLPCAHPLSKGDFTVVFWPIRSEPTQSRPPDTARMSTVKPSTWLSRQWRRSRMWVLRGSTGAAAGTVRTPSTLNSPARVNGHVKPELNSADLPES